MDSTSLFVPSWPSRLRDRRSVRGRHFAPITMPGSQDHDGVDGLITTDGTGTPGASGCREQRSTRLPCRHSGQCERPTRARNALAWRYSRRRRPAQSAMPAATAKSTPTTMVRAAVSTRMGPVEISQLTYGPPSGQVTGAKLCVPERGARTSDATTALVGHMRRRSNAVRSCAIRASSCG